MAVLSTMLAIEESESGMFRRDHEPESLCRLCWESVF